MEKQCNQKSVQVVVSLLDNASNYLVVGCIIQRRSPKFHFFDIRAGYYDIFSFQWHDLSKFALSTCNSDHHHYIPLYTLKVGWNFLVKKCNLLVKPHCNWYSLKIYRDTPDFFFPNCWYFWLWGIIVQLLIHAQTSHYHALVWNF